MSNNLVGNAVWWFCWDKEHLVQSARLKLAIKVPSKMSQDAVQDGWKGNSNLVAALWIPLHSKKIGSATPALCTMMPFVNNEGVDDVELPGGIPNSLVLSSLVAKQLMLGGKCFHY